MLEHTKFLMEIYRSVGGKSNVACHWRELPGGDGSAVHITTLIKLRYVGVAYPNPDPDRIVLTNLGKEAGDRIQEQYRSDPSREDK
jgi:hypothetical protein